MPHHFAGRVDVVSAPMVISPCVELWPVIHEALVVVYGHLGHGILTTRQYHHLL